MSPAEHQINDNVDTSKEDHPERTISRRRLLKTLAAAGGAVAATTLLPSKWAKPVVEVGVLPVHAQVSVVAIPTDTPEPPVYTAFCDSIPGGGSISVGLPSGTGRITDIEASLVLTSGIGPIENIAVTMTAEAVPPASPLPTFTPLLPLTALTAATGVANFGTLDVTGTPILEFSLVFSFAVPGASPETAICSIYRLE